ncbi:MAG: TSUP family transporter [Streptosporangiales bacterium]|nr:TSUP family transporter [Streptosporangiales bacterium]
MEPAQLLAAVSVVTLAALLGGITGFGYGLVSTPLLLAVGLPLPTIVVLNLILGTITRGTAAWRFRREVSRRSAFLIAGSVPGYAIGTALLVEVDLDLLETAAGVLVITLAIASIVPRGPKVGAGPVSCLVAGAAGGTLGATTALNGVLPALLLSHARLPARPFIGELAVYIVASNLVGLVAVAVGGVSAFRLGPLVAVSLLPAVLANIAGTTLGPRLPAKAFRAVTLALVLTAGVVTIISR